MRKIIFLISALLLASCDDMTENQSTKIVFLGDSITQQAEDFENGFISLLRQNLSQEEVKLVG